jgi:hypothetical protein
MVRVSLLSLMDSIPLHVWEAEEGGNVMGSKDMRQLWSDFVNAAHNTQPRDSSRSVRHTGRHTQAGTHRQAGSQTNDQTAKGKARV